MSWARSATHWLGRRYLPVVEALSARSWASIPRPPERRAVTRGAGSDPYRVLLAGGSSAVGWGVMTHDLGLAGYLARLISAYTGRGTDLEVFASLTTTVDDVREFVGRAAGRYDLVVLTLGTRESFELVSVEQWERSLAELLDEIASAAPHPPGVVVVGAELELPVDIPRWYARMVAARATELNAATRTLVADREHVRYVDSGMIAGGGASGLFDAGPRALYTRAAATIAPAAVLLLDGSPDDSVQPIDEASRMRAVEYLRNLEPVPSRVRDLLMTLHNMLHVRSVDLYFVDTDYVSTLATTRDAPAARDRRSTVADSALEHRHGLIVPDLTLDDRFRDRPEVTGEPFLRFYAAYPVESPEGNRVCLLSIVDTQPRDLTPGELRLIRQFAITIGSVLFEGFS